MLRLLHADGTTTRARSWWLGTFVVLGLGGVVGCSSAHTDELPDTGLTLDGARADGAVPADTGIVVLPDGGTVIVLPDGAVVPVDAAPPLDDGGVPADALGDDAAAHDDAAIVLPDGAVVHADAGAPSARVGTPCTTDAECPGLFCSPAGTGFGYCSWLCGGTMTCPGDSVCVQFTAGSVGYCMARCDPAAGATCATGFVCEPGFATAPVCYPGCTTDADCPMATHCGMGASGIRSCFTPSSMVGAPCSSSAECPESGYCLDETSWGTPHGLCVTFCDLATHAGCGAGTTCVAWGTSSGGAYGSCIPTCDGTHPCRAGYECVPTGAGAPNACVSRCTSDAECTAPHSCNFVTGRCS